MAGPDWYARDQRDRRGCQPPGATELGCQARAAGLLLSHRAPPEKQEAGSQLLADIVTSQLVQGRRTCC